VITAYVRCSDGPEGAWVFDVAPCLGDRVTLQNPHGYYKVVRVEHYPTPEGEVRTSDAAIALRLLLIDADEPVWDSDL
jgi:hypothetical protein